MEEIIEIDAESPEDAIRQVCMDLGVKPEALEVEEEQTGGRGLLGLGRRKSKVRVKVKPRGEIARGVTETILELLDLPASVALVEQEDSSRLEITGEDLGVAIGRHGHTMDALQLLVGLISSRINPNGKKIIIDISGYRKQREEDVRGMAERAITRVLQTGVPFNFRPMSAFDRKVVHTVVADREGVVSSSSGEEPERAVTISPAGT